LLTAALPGSLYIYQGDELGLPEVEDLPRELLEDPMHFRSGGRDPGRDGCRVPLPWSGDRAPFGFTEADTAWLPQPPDWAQLTVERQAGDPGSMLSLYRTAVAVRRREGALHDGALRWLDSDGDVLAFSRGADFVCLVNLGPEPAALPEGSSVLLASDDLVDGRLPEDTAVWLRTARPHRSAQSDPSR
jgi:alpha-glucosidase